MMAEKSDEKPASETSTPLEDKSAGNWWDSWLTSAKTKHTLIMNNGLGRNMLELEDSYKSAEVYSMVKKDLDEIGTAVKSEASHVFTSTSTVIGKTLKLDEPESPANVMKKSLSSFIGQVSTVLNPEPDDEDDTEVILSSGDTTMLSTYKKELEALQRVDATFLVPAYSAEFEAWRASLEPSEPLISPGSAVKRLNSSPILRAMYQKLVPDAVTHDEFWERYLFRVALLQDRLAAASRKQPAEEAAPTTDPVLAHLPLQCQTPIQQSPKKVLSGVEEEAPAEVPETDNIVAWEDEDFANDVELTEEQQILLLEEYEKEISTKKHKHTSSRDLTNNNMKNKVTDAHTGQKTKAAQTRDKMNNKQNGRSPKKAGKPDVCGNNLVEDYFAEKEPVTDDASANSDESWEKEFEIDEVEKA